MVYVLGMLAMLALSVFIMSTNYGNVRDKIKDDTDMLFASIVIGIGIMVWPIMLPITIIFMFIKGIK